ncbi:MAG: ExbD/TolR family protein [Candidatus Eiseniibacteriota bacterium]
MRGYLAHTAALQRRGRQNNEAVLARLQLTSLIDIFTVLLLFLLKSLVVGGTVVTPFPGVTLPSSSASEAFKESPVVVITNQQVVVDGEGVCPTADVANSERLRIEPIEQALAALRQKSDALAAKSTARKFEGRLIVQADERIPFHILQKVMYTSQTVGFYDITLAVIQSQ